MQGKIIHRFVQDFGHSLRRTLNTESKKMKFQASEGEVESVDERKARVETAPLRYISTYQGNRPDSFRRTEIARETISSRVNVPHSAATAGSGRVGLKRDSMIPLWGYRASRIRSGPQFGQRRRNAASQSKSLASLTHPRVDLRPCVIIVCMDSPRRRWGSDRKDL